MRSRPGVHYILRLHRLALRVLFIIVVISRDGVARFAGDSKEEDFSFMARRSRSRNVITGVLNLFEVHCEVRRDAAEVLMATRDPIHSLAPRSLSSPDSFCQLQDAATRL